MSDLLELRVFELRGTGSFIELGRSYFGDAFILLFDLFLENLKFKLTTDVNRSQESFLFKLVTCISVALSGSSKY